VQEKKRIQTTDVCDTLLARDYKDPKCIPVEEEPEVKQIGNVCPTKTRDNPNQGRVYDVNGIAPTLTKMDGGNREPMVIEENKQVVTTDIKERFFRQVMETIMENACEPGDMVDAFNKKVNHTGICPTITTRPDGFKTAILPIVEEQEPVIIQKFGDRGTSQYSIRDYAHTIPANPMSDRGQMVIEPEPFIVASRGRNPDNPSDRTTGAPTEQRLEPNFTGCTNTLTSVQKDNYICEPQVLRAERTEYGKAIRKQYEAGEVNEKIGNMREMKPRTDGVANTITTLLKDNYVAEPQSLWTETQKKMITEDGNVKRYINSDVVDEFNVGDCADISFPNGYNKANRVFDGYAPALNGTTTQSSFIVKEPIVYDDYNSRISSDQDAINTLTCNCGASAERNGVKILEKTVIIEDQFPGSRDARIYENYSPTLRQNCGGLEVANGEIQDKIKWRIRKLTPKECWRLMGFADNDHDRAAKFTSASARYKQAGNSICTCCLVALFSSLFIKDGHKADVWSKYKIDFNN